MELGGRDQIAARGRPQEGLCEQDGQDEAGLKKLLGRRRFAAMAAAHGDAGFQALLKRRRREAAGRKSAVVQGVPSAWIQLQTPLPPNSYNLSRFVGVFDGALAELQAGRKRSLWMWFIFPQLRGLGSLPPPSTMACPALTRPVPSSAIR
ncbi:DUF1810 family protein [Bosea sp. (in: a-proteobacteria)]|uniref:DUF1810 family protein n=1 Tax=Bosea sp. (in: a-proteobacteria) TaxID=1871050 RepID=UPI00343A4366